MANYGWSNEPLDPHNMSYDETCYYIYGIDIDAIKDRKNDTRKNICPPVLDAGRAR